MRIAAGSWLCGRGTRHAQTDLHHPRGCTRLYTALGRRVWCSSAFLMQRANEIEYRHLHSMQVGYGGRGARTAHSRAVSVKSRLHAESTAAGRSA